MSTKPYHQLCPLDGRYQNKVQAIRQLFSEAALIKHRLQVEVHWLKTLAQQATIEPLHKAKDHLNTALDQILADFDDQAIETIKGHEAQCNHDVKAIEYYLKEQLNSNSALSHLSEFVHFSCTSEDINNIAYALMVKSTVHDVLLPTLGKLTNTLRQQAKQYASQAMLARTHGQAATPTTLGKEIANTFARLQHPISQLQTIDILAKCNGAIGNYNAHCIAFPDIDWPSVTNQLITSLDLSQNPYTTQIEPHDWIAELAHILIRINTILLDYSRDTWHYISLHYYQQPPKAAEVGSSTMPHKINPIDFENAEGNIGLANSLLDHFANKLPISRLQRDLSDSTVLRNLGVAFGYAYLAYQALQNGMAKTQVNPKALDADLAQHWEVLAEAVQTRMRQEGLPEPYEQLKQFSRGKQLDQSMLHDFIKQSGLSPDSQTLLLKLTPQTYLGLATELTMTLCNQDPPKVSS